MTCLDLSHCDNKERASGDSLSASKPCLIHHPLHLSKLSTSLDFRLSSSATSSKSQRSCAGQIYQPSLELEEEQTESVADTILAACPRVRNLFVLDDLTPQYLPILSQLDCLLRLAIDQIDLESLFEPSAIDFGEPLFRNLTHLELLDGSLDLPSDVALIPNLTHIAFNTNSGIAALHSRTHANARLRCIVFLRPSHLGEESIPFSDTRLVCIRQTNFRADWLSGATTGVDYWALADAFIAAKQAGKIDRSWYCISDTDRDASWWP
ncbi:hypothetical protein B0H19DRAFT_1250656 [Mycena capillaripes]|nr:hypothetical protein B0H19DRAFT_1250656 [Mycena capillaripes]